MAGFPQRRAMLERLRQKGGLRWFCEQVANGRTILDLANELQTSRWQLYRYINKTERNLRAYKLAQMVGADARIEEAKAIVDREDPNDTKVKVARDQLRSEFRKYLASVANPEVYGKKDTRDVTINISELHLNALRNRVVEERQILEANNAQALPSGYRKAEHIVDAEIVEEK